MASGPNCAREAGNGERQAQGGWARVVPAAAYVALARRERHEGLGEGVVLAVGAKEAGCVLVTGEGRARVSRERAGQVGCVAWAYVGRSLGDEILVLCKGTQAGGRSAGVARG